MGSIILIYSKGIISNGKYYQYTISGAIKLERNYSNSVLISEYSHSDIVKNGPFKEYYSDGKIKIEGVYNYDKREVYKRYGTNAYFFKDAKTVGRVVVAIVTIGLVIAGRVYLSGW